MKNPLNGEARSVTNRKGEVASRFSARKARSSSLDHRVRCAAGRLYQRAFLAVSSMHREGPGGLTLAG